MKKILLYLLFIISASFYAQTIPSYYNDLDLNKTGDALFLELSTRIIETHSGIPYTGSPVDVWDACKEADEDPNNNSNVLLIYGFNDADGISDTDKTRNKDLQDTGGGDAEKWNREHVFPKSLANPSLETDEPGPGTDVHNLRPADAERNTLRGNRKFTDGTGNSGIISANGGWYPGDEWKGDVARIVMYMYMRYNGDGYPISETNCFPINVGFGDINSLDPNMVELFLQWNVDDPVSDFEANRNEVLAGIQMNRNPFIDNPYLATLIWGGLNAEDKWNMGDSSDTEVPTAPSNVIASNITDESFDLNWTASTDNVEVYDYLIYLDGVYLQTSATTSVTITNLDPKTTYAVTIKARDLSSNLSTESTVFQVKTLDGPRILFEEDFEDCASLKFNAYSEASNKDWRCETQYGENGSGSMGINGYQEVVSSKDWLITNAPIDFDAETGEKISFYTDAAFGSTSLVLVYSSDYDGSGDPLNFTWVNVPNITIPTHTTGTSTEEIYEFNEIDISAINGTSVYIAFKYYSDGNPTRWTVDSFEIIADDLNPDTDGDGVLNEDDVCPNTPAGETVNDDGCSTSQFTFVPDNNFEQVLIDLGVDDVLDDYVITNKIEKVVDLFIDQKNIADLTGIEDFTSLKYLTCYGNQLKSLDVSNNVDLEYLTCTSNQLTSLDVTKNTALIRLDVSSNEIDNINVTKNILLNDLNVSSNNLTVIDVSMNVELKDFNCSINDLTVLSTINNKEIERLECFNNKITSINVNENTELKELYCNYNELTSLDVSQNRKLELLFTSDNFLVSLDVTSNTLLVRLSCRTNEIESLDLSNNSLLTYLSCRENKLAVLDVSLNTALIDLYCHNNDLISLNVKNGNNTNFNNFNAIDNPALNCIEVDNVEWSGDNWLEIDAHSNFREDCHAVWDSQLDDDNDGVMNNVDQCSETPTGEAVNAEGCSNGQLDDDNDGVQNSDDSCADTPAGEGVNASGCSESQLDDDEDGVMNNIDQCAETPTGEGVNADGCSESQLDDDNDGIMNNVDQCLATTAGAQVNELGCFTLAATNFKIETVGETCTGSSNGKIIITTVEDFNYKTTIDGVLHSFNTSLEVENLASKTYDFCISVDGETYEQCFTVNIEAGGTIAGKTSIKSNKAVVELSKGTAPFTVVVNGKELFETSASSFSVGVSHGDLVEVKTAIDCEGKITKQVNLFETVLAYPNPTKGLSNISLPISEKEVVIELYNIHSQLISSKVYPVNYGKVQLNLEEQPTGVYIAKVLLAIPVTLKVVKN